MPRPPPPGRGAPGARRPMRDFFAAWLATLRSPLLPLLRRALSSSTGSWDDPLSSAAAAVEAHFQAHWSALDAAARQDPARVVASGDWRSPLELPFLWLGDVHPSLLTSLLRTLSPSPRLLAAADRVDRRIRAAVPAVSDRLRRAQKAFVVAEVAGTADVEAFLEELKGVALAANRLRRGVLSELVAAAGGYQAALYLEALSRFVLSMHDPEVLRRFDQCRPSPVAKPGRSERKDRLPQVAVVCPRGPRAADSYGEAPVVYSYADVPRFAAVASCDGDGALGPQRSAWGSSAAAEPRMAVRNVRAYGERATASLSRGGVV
uniref:DOG1 domain-containing protein n=1 Tax=Setaria italica TaxID=4555 RepID=A0A0Q3VVN4_SETIT